MKSLTKKISILLAVLLILFVGIFWGRICNSYHTYTIISSLNDNLKFGNEKYSFLLKAFHNKNPESSDSLSAYIFYNAGKDFIADVTFNQKHYHIKSVKKSTKVYMGPSKLLVSGEGIDEGKFDVLELLGEVLDTYPQTKKLLNLSLLQKLGLGGWIFMNCSFDDFEKNGIMYDKISVPFENIDFDLLIEQNSGKSFQAIAEFENQSITVNLELQKPVNGYIDAKIMTDTVISVKRDELNRAIHRGALRTGSLLLSRIEKPELNETELSYGNGKLMFVNGNRVLTAKGTHEEIGKIQGALLKEEIRKMIDATLYTMCWVYTAEKKSWFIDDFRSAYKRLEPFIPDRFNNEMKGISETSGIPLAEIQLTNVFPALFHCSGFAVFDSASFEGKLYHGRVLDYIIDLGLQFSAVVFIIKPEGYNAFANVGYAGFVGSVTGMNEKQISFGEMGGKGEGDWDGMPMAFLMRDGLERANTLDEAINIFSETPRTCEYYYVIADGKIPDARGLAATPYIFDVIKPNDYREKLDEPVQDAVIISGGDRYKHLVKRVKENFGKIDSITALRLMDRPVAMKSNLHNALFAPQSFDFWVANAGNNSPAANEPYTKYNLLELLNMDEK